MAYASVALLHQSLIHQDRLFTYRIPDGIDVSVGSIVRVLVARVRSTGVVVGVMDEPDVARTLPILGLVGRALPEHLVALATWVGDRYLSTIGEAVNAALPQRVASEEEAAGPGSAPKLPTHADLGWLRGWRNAAALVRSVERGGHASVSLQPPPRAERGPMIASLVAAALRRGRGAIVILPDVRARTGVAEAVEGMVGEHVAWLGSDRSARDRYRDWLALDDCRKRVAAGGRAAIFAPVRDLGLIVIDDEAHSSHKERRAPRFHARTVAAERARREQATLIAVGTPPSVEVAAACEARQMLAVAPPRTAVRDDRPPVTVVDLEKEPERLVPTGRAIAAINQALSRKGRVLILTHRGGDAAAAVADRVRRVAKTSAARIDARTSPADARKALRSAPVVVATAVAAKDLAVERLALLVVVHADAALSHADFRTPEEAFGTWWRTARLAGAVVIETAQAQHPAVRALVRYDPGALASFEIARRRELGYPPFGGLARIGVPPGQAETVAKEAEQAGGIVLGPIEASPSSSVVVVRAGSRKELELMLGPLARRWRASGVDARIDIDPREVLP